MHKFHPGNAARLEVPEHERLAEEDLDAQLNGFRIMDGGMLNPSHCYRIIQRS
jgi:hypothetical protein